MCARWGGGGREARTIAILILLSGMYQLNHSSILPRSSPGLPEDTEGKLEKYHRAGVGDVWNGQLEWGLGGGRDNHKERERGEEEINLLIFHGQAVIISVLGALRANLSVCICVREGGEMD